MGRRSPQKIPLQITTRRSRTPDFKFELLPLHSPLLGQSLLVSFPPLIDMLKFSGYPYLIRGVPNVSLCPARRTGQGWQPRRARASSETYHARPRGRRPPMDSSPVAAAVRHATAATTAPFTGARIRQGDARTGMPPGMPGGAMCVQRFDDSLNSAIHITYRISLRSSSMREPRDPLLKVFVCLLACYFFRGTLAFRRRGAAGWLGGIVCSGPFPGAVPGEATGMCTQRVGFGNRRLAVGGREPSTRAPRR